MRGMGGIMKAPLRGMGGLPSDSMGSGIKRIKKRQFLTGLLFIARQVNEAVVPQRGGDLIVACCRRQGSSPTLASGWTLLKSGYSGSVDVMLAAYKFVSSLDPESPAWGAADTVEYLHFRNVRAVGDSRLYQNGGANANGTGTAAALSSWGNSNSYELVFNVTPITERTVGFDLIPESARTMISKGKLETAPAISFGQSSGGIGLSMAVELRAFS